MENNNSSYRDYLVNAINSRYDLLGRVEERCRKTPEDVLLRDISSFINNDIWRYNRKLSEYDYKQKVKESNIV